MSHTNTPFVLTFVGSNVARELNVLLPSGVKPLDDNARVFEAIDALKASGYGLRDTLVTLTMAGLFDRRFASAYEAKVSQPQPQPTVQDDLCILDYELIAEESLTHTKLHVEPVIADATPVNKLACVDCEPDLSEPCAFRFDNSDEDGLCSTHYMEFTLDVERSQDEVDELNQSLVAL